MEESLEEEEEEEAQTLYAYTLWFSIASVMAMVLSIGNIVFFVLLDFWTTPGTLYKNFCPPDPTSLKGSSSMKRFQEMGFPGRTIPVFCFIEKGKCAFAKYHGIWCLIAKLVPVILDLINPCTGECGATTTAASTTSFGLVVGVMKMVEAAIQKLINALDSLTDNMTAAEILCKGGDAAERTKKSMKLAEIAGVGVGIAKEATAMLPGKLQSMFPFMEYFAAFGLMGLAFPRKPEGIALHAIALVDQIVITQVCNEILNCIPAEVQEMFDQFRLEIEEIRDGVGDEAKEKLLEITESMEKHVLPVAEKLMKVMNKTEAAVMKLDGMISKVEEKMPEGKRALLTSVKEGVLAASKGLQSVSVPLKEKRDLVMRIIEQVTSGTPGPEVHAQLDSILDFLTPAKLLRRLSNQLRADMYGVIVDQLQMLMAKSSKRFLKKASTSKSEEKQETSKKAAETEEDIESMPMLRASANPDEGPTPLNLQSPPSNHHRPLLSPASSTISNENLLAEDEKSELMKKAVERGMQYWEAKNSTSAELRKYLSDQGLTKFVEEGPTTLVLNETTPSRGGSPSRPKSAMRDNAWVTPEQPERPAEIDESRISLPNGSAPLIQ
jgi:hypothetical protein